MLWLEIAILIVVSADLSINVWALTHVRKPQGRHGPVL